LRENYVYYEDRQERKIAVAGFSRPTYNSSTACIAILDGNSFGAEQTPEQVQCCRSFGSPVILVYRDDVLQFWHFSNGQAVRKEQKRANELDKFFEKYKDKFSPTSISRAKTCGRFDKKNQQLSFFDYGLMPIIEKQEGEYLSGLIERIINKLSKSANIDQESDQGAGWLTQAAFWLVGAKILKDKEVEDFKTLDIADIDSLSRRINRHYDAKTPLDITDPTKKKALGTVASEILGQVSSFAHLTIDSLAYVYENTLVTPATRKALGTHSTPSWLVNYIVWQFADWIEDIPEKDRVILEPACGHAPFLTAGARILGFLHKGKEPLHKYLKNHLIGIEKDSFAEEIARLALTLTDIPNKDGWQLSDADIYNGDILKDAAQRANILLCNPPFGNFSKEDKEKYKNLETGNKAAEVLARTLCHMLPKSVFGIILPRVFLHRKNLSPLRKYIIENFEIREICLLPENVFGSASHLSCLVLGRKVRENDKITNKNKIRYVRISKDDLDEFKDTYNTTETEIINQQVAKKASDYDFRLSILLSDVWEYCDGLSRLSDIAVVGRGLEYKNVKNSTSREYFTGAVQGFVRFSRTKEDKRKRKKTDIKLTELPDLYWMDLSDDAIENPRYGKSPECAQVLLNYARTSGNNPWRLKALIDRERMPVTNSFLVIRPENTEWSLEAIWALLNSPFANAFAFCYCMERHNLESIIRGVPLPKCNSSDLQTLKGMVLDYFALYQDGFFQSEAIDKEGEKRMSAINAEVMRLYDLPPKLEREVLDLFNGYKRKGIYFKFDRYFPEGFESWIPLHEYFSEEYQRSTPSFVNEWVEKNRSHEVIKALNAAVEAFEG